MRNPSLPQHDNPRRSRHRRRLLDRAQRRYVWSTSSPNLPDVPLANGVPAAQLPTAGWVLFALGPVVIRALRNQLVARRGLAGLETLAVPDGLEADASLEQDLDELEHLIERYSESLAAAEAESVIAEDEELEDEDGLEEDELEDEDAALETAFFENPFGKRILALLDAILSGASLGAKELEVQGLEAVSSTGLGAYDRLFRRIPLPAIQRTFQDDETFARMRVAGPNPMLIRGISELPNNFPVREDHYRAAIGGDDTLAEALASGRVYLLDYAELATIERGVWNDRDKYLAAPLALFTVPKGHSSLVPVAIQCSQDPGGPIFNRSIAVEEAWSWRMAKTVVQIADGNYHELFCHLARTHLVIEAVAVATHRELSSMHPLFILLEPHLEGTMFINARAAGGLIAPGGPIDAIFGGTIESTQHAAAQDRLSFDFLASLPKTSFAERGVENLADYPYRDDATRVWDVLHAWVGRYVRIYYANEGELRGDTELSAWVQALKSDGRISKLGVVSTRDELIDVLTMIIFTASAQHAAVNFPQGEVMTYAPFISGATWAPDPDARTGKTRADWEAQLAPIALALQQLTTLYTLGSVYYSTLWDAKFHYQRKFRDPKTRDALAELRRGMHRVEAEIDAANSTRAEAYEFLKPSKIPMSINI